MKLGEISLFYEVNAMSRGKGLFKVPKARRERRRSKRTTDTNKDLT